MTDREMLEFAAKAAGIKGYRYVKNEAIQGGLRTGLWSDLYEYCWNPLTDDGDAFRLAVKLKIHIQWIDHDVPEVYADTPGTIGHGALEGDDPFKAMRYAITGAAAEIGKAMP